MRFRFGHSSPAPPVGPEQGDRVAALAALMLEVGRAGPAPGAILDALASHCATQLGDLAVVTPIAARGAVWAPAAVRHRAPASDVLARAAAATTAPCSPVAPLQATGPAAVEAASPELLGLDDPAWAAYLAHAGVGSGIVLPLRARDRAVALLTLVRDRGSPPYGPHDVAHALAVADHVTILYDNACLHERLAVQATVLDEVDAAVVAADLDGRITTWNPAAERLFGWPAADVVGRPSRELLTSREAATVDDVRAEAIRHGHAATRWMLRRRGGARFPGSVRLASVHDARGRVSGTVAVFEDLTVQRAMVHQLKRRVAQQAAVAALGERALESEDATALLDHAVDVLRATLSVELAELLELADDGRTFLVRAGAGFVSGVVRQAGVPAGWGETQEGFTLIGREPVIVRDARRDRRFEQSELLRVHGAISAITVVVQGRGGPFGVLGAQSVRPDAFDPDDVAFLQGVANVLGDALDRWGTEAAVRRRGLHDPLTELPNRTLVLDRLSHALDRGPRTVGEVALLFVDVDRFKDVNDSLGHRAGDALLVEIARRLARAVRPADTVGRFGGDEFVVLCEEVADEDEALAIAQRIQQGFVEPLAIEGEILHIGVSVGVALRSAPGDAEALLRDADAAMYRAKERGRSRVELFDLGMRTQVTDRLAVERALRVALAEQQLEVHYQPIVDLADGRIAAVEALVRWRHPERGVLAPQEFVPIAEECGLIIELGRRVLELSCTQAAAWALARPDQEPLAVHVNLSPRQLADQGLVDDVEHAMSVAGAAPRSLTLEITEGMLVDRTPARTRLLTALRDLGVGVELDDFGTGFSSLSYLARLPITGLKVDRSFVAGLDNGQGPIVDAVVRLAHALELSVVAEGVEDEAQLAGLRELGCELGQGFLFAPAMSADELTPHLVGRERRFTR